MSVAEGEVESLDVVDRKEDDVVRLMLNTKIATLQNEKLGGKTKFSEKDVPVGKFIKTAQKDVKKELDELPPEKREERLMALLMEQKKLTFLAEARATFHENRCILIEDEKAAAYAQLKRATDVKDKLDSLCRELQKRNKSLTEELKQLGLAQKRQHEVLGEKFQTIQDQLMKHEDDRKAQAEENEKLHQKISKLLQYDTAKDEQYAQQLKMKDIEAKLTHAKLEQQVYLSSMTQQTLIQTKEELSVMAQTETLLRAQLSEYAKKFEAVQDTLNKSNELFITFKSEMEKMSKQMKKQEQSKAELEKKNHECQASLVAMLDRQKADKESYDKLARQKDKLSSLCKLLETENKRLSSRTTNDTESPPHEADH